MNKKIILCLIILLLYIEIPLIIYFNIINFKHRFVLLTVFGLLIYIIARLLKYNNKELGISTSNLKKSFIRILPVTLVGIIFTVGCIIFKLNKFNNNSTIWFYLFYIFVSCPIQELLYREY